MTGVFKTVSALVTEIDTTLADGQGAGTITPLRIRQMIEDLVSSLAPTETALTFSATLSWSLDTNPIAYVILTGNTTITLSGGTVGQSYRLGLIQDATGGRTVTLSGCTTLGTPLWATTANGINIVTVDIMNSVLYAAVA